MYKIALFFGGTSPEHEVSLRSAACVLRHLSRTRYEPICVAIAKDGGWHLAEPDPACIARGACFDGARVFLSPDPTRPGLFIESEEGYRRVLPDLLFPVLHGGSGEGGEMQGLFRLSGIPFIGCRTEAAAVSLNKALTKTVLAPLDIPMLPFAVLHRTEDGFSDFEIEEAEERLGYPMFLKPLRGGSSVGAGRANGRKELLLRLHEAAREDGDVIAEPYADVREVELAVCTKNGRIFVSQPGEIQVEGGFYGYAEKYENAGSVKLHESAELPEKTVMLLRAYALRAFLALGIRSLARVDFFIKKSDGSILFNEVNTLPGFTDISMFPRLASEGGDISHLLDRLIEEAMVP
jgi:D-alanine-D-alanine ligase